MKIQIWNAFASNNSGSYTIVGRFRDEATATAAAEELRAVIAVHNQWHQDPDNQWTQDGNSPLEKFAAANSLNTTQGSGCGEDWPDYGEPPAVVATGSQIVLHVDYTITMPPLFGEFIYRRGGRVEMELDHSHSPLVWLHSIWWPWKEAKDKAPKGVPAILAELYEDGGPFVSNVSLQVPPSWTDHGGDWGHPQLSIAACWRDPIAGVAEVRKIAQKHGADVHTRVMESMSASDPTGIYRPSAPHVSLELVDVVLVAKGDAPAELVRRIQEHVLGMDRTWQSKEARALMDRAPVTLAYARPKRRAEALVALLQTGGARFELRTHAYPVELS